MNVICMGDLPTIQEIAELGKPGSKYTVAEVEKMFDKGVLLPPELIAAIVKKIDNYFIEHMMKDKGPIDKFGSMAKMYKIAINNYKVAMLNAVEDWQKKHKTKNGKLNANLQGRIVYVMCRGPDGEALHPLLTFSYIIALNILLGRITSMITKVSNYSIIVY